jgi:uncharacterized protein involved in exopolysaccharide biosynthesis
VEVAPDPEATAPRFVVIVSGTQAGGTVYRLRSARTTIGSGETADIQIPDRSIAPVHAVVTASEAGLAVERLASEAHGQRQVTQVGDGDIVRFGAIGLTFHQHRGDLRTGEYPWQPVLPAGQKRLRAAAEERTLSLLDLAKLVVRLWAFLLRHKGLLALAGACGLAAGVAAAMAIPPRLTATATVVLHPEVRANPVEPRRQEPADPTTQFFYDVTRGFSNREIVRATLKTLPGSPLDEEAIRRATLRLKIESIGPNEYEVFYSPTADDPGADDPAGFLDTHMKAYLSPEVASRLKVMVAELDFLQKQMGQLDGELQTVSARAVEYKQKHVDRLPEHTPLTPETRATMEARRVELTGLVQRLEGDVETLRRRIGRGAPLVAAKSQSAQVHRERLASIEQQLGELRARGLADGHPEVGKLLEQKDVTQRLISTQMTSETSSVDRLANVEYENLRFARDQGESNLRAALTELDSVRESLGNFNRISREMPRVSARVGELSQQEEGLRRLRGQLFDRVKRAELQLELERVSARSRYEIVEPVHLEPLRIERRLAGAGLLGLFTGLAVAFALLAAGATRRLLKRAARELG